MSNFKTTPSQITDRPPFNVAKKMHEAYFGPPDEVQPATPEQMREAANNDEDLIRRIDAITVAHQYTTSLDDPRMFAEMRAIPIAPQPVAVSTLESVYDHMPDIPGLPDAYQPRNISAALRVLRQSTQPVAGPPVETFVMRETVVDAISYERKTVEHLAVKYADYLKLSAMTIHPADPLSDPRVVALVEAAGKLRRSVCGPTGFADAVRHNSGQAYPWPSLDAAELALDAAIRAIGGEA